MGGGGWGDSDIRLFCKSCILNFIVVSEHSQAHLMCVCVWGGGGGFWGPPRTIILYELKRFIFAQI